ncbi:cytochrome c oxidase assembly factor CtaG [Bacillus sp. V3-13]|uniref:cytochrome c oxidase assembly factor CtaG n=1 Tax=Bacillus sp. V3-13 TaxID=2053728 RepID=UPI000C77C92A|nr:cytochrome c oxidase assembly factor CtaG [Bacillus sp. V3-13]PLR79200.1 cytochrome c oxidase assembly factor CtaG [Bacillus sp. V3-13]
MLSLDIFGFRAMWSPYFFVAILAVTAVFFLITVKYRDRFSGSAPLQKKEAVLFVATAALLYAIKGSPLDLMGHLAFYAHMIQMALLYLVIPPLFIVAIPEWMWRKVLGMKSIGAVFRFLTKPIVALILFNGLFSFYHIPLIFDVVKTDMLLHAAYTTMLFLMAIIMWWPLVNQLDEYQTMGGLKKVGYIFANGILLTPACALIIFADAPMYETFSDPRAWADALALCVPASTLSGLNLSGPEMFSSMSLLNDQQTGGVIMKIIQEIVYGVVLGKVFFSWYKKEQEADQVDMNPSLNPQTIE